MYKIGNRELKVYNQVDQIDRMLWDSIRDKDNLLTDYNFLKTIEAANVFACDYLYLEFYDKDDLICTMSGYTFTRDLGLFLDKTSRKILSAFRRIVSNLLYYKTVEIASPISSGLPISIRSDVTERQLTGVVKLLRSYCAVNGIKLIVLRDFNDKNSSMEKVVLQTGFKMMLNLPITKMNIEWKSFDEYLSRLKIKYRRNIRKNMRKKAEYGIQTAIVKGRDSLEHLKSYVKLYQNVREKSKAGRVFIGEKYHISMVENLSDYSYWLQYFKEGELVAFSHLIAYQGHVYDRYIGLDYDVSNKAGLYFNSYYDIIEFAISHNLKSIDAGQTTYGVKSTVGFSVLPQRMYLWHENVIFRILVARIYNFLLNPEIENCHYAFKDNRYQHIWDGREKFLTAAG
ncbi:GNAT family N-acetyltransferase [Thermodesulfobacteriota bacterium]